MCSRASEHAEARGHRLCQPLAFNGFSDITRTTCARKKTAMRSHNRTVAQSVSVSAEYGTSGPDNLAAEAHAFGHGLEVSDPRARLALILFLANILYLPFCVRLSMTVKTTSTECCLHAACSWAMLGTTVFSSWFKQSLGAGWGGVLWLKLSLYDNMHFFFFHLDPCNPSLQTTGGGEEVGLGSPDILF